MTTNSCLVSPRRSPPPPPGIYVSHVATFLLMYVHALHWLPGPVCAKCTKKASMSRASRQCQLLEVRNAVAGDRHEDPTIDAVQDGEDGWLHMICSRAVHIADVYVVLA